jgi:hypothetical protein
MHRDADDLIVMDGEWPGSIGDSCAETTREMLLNNKTEASLLALCEFVTPTGIIRHPLAPIDWREQDTSSDQLAPLYMASAVYGIPYAPDGIYRICEHIRAKYPYRQGNGQFHNPITYCIIWGHHRLLNLFLLLQLFLMTCLPFRWNDGYKKFESTKDSSADWLNWYCACYYLKVRHANWFKPPIEKVAERVYHYYRNESNNKLALNAYEESFKIW